jgi:chorismate mutase
MVLPTYASAPSPSILTRKSDLLGPGSVALTAVGHDGRMEDELEVLRQEIDAVDERFVELLAERFRITRRVGRIKAERGLPAQDAIREAQIDAKVRRLAAEYELDESLVSDVLRAVIDRVVAEHRQLAPDA